MSFKHPTLLIVLTVVTLGLAACGDDGDSGNAQAQRDTGADSADDGGTPDADDPLKKSAVGAVPEFAQRPGDPEAGYDALVNNGYITCGVPVSVADQFFGPAPDHGKLPGRDPKHADRWYNETVTTTKSGVEVVTTNCLGCHAGYINGELVVGLGDHQTDFTQDPSGFIGLAVNLTQDETERAEIEKLAQRTAAIGPYATTDVVGTNPAETLTAALIAHHDPETLAWSDELLIPLEVLGDVDTIPLDVPPWWWMSKKNAMFYHTAGRGDHARHMMTASIFCTDTIEEAEEIDSYFPDIRAFISSIEPPRWPFDLDDELAAEGETVFVENCSRCHGTYGEDWTYPNLVVSLEEVGTDDLLAVGATTATDDFIIWFNSSFWGDLAVAAPAPGYIAPPLDGIWATAPFLHNGSVPTLAALLESSRRPQFWTRSYDSTDYNTADVGWNYTALDHGQADEEDSSVRKRIYDTTMRGYSNRGHTFGDELSDTERTALLEYLKTL